MTLIDKMKKTIGRKDKADFPELMLTDLDIKVDTGAYTSSIHCHHIEEKEVDGEKCIAFSLLDPSHPEYNDKQFIAHHYTEKPIKNSFGQSEKRFVISTSIILFGEEYPIELSLSERSEMKSPVLIGRKLLNKRFLVDTDKINLSFKLKKQSLKKHK